ncbi:Ascorbate transporter, chloroplastic, partial [Armadillidium nasatum]
LKCIPARVVLAILCATGIIELYISRTNLSIAIVEMVQIVNERDDILGGRLAENYGTKNLFGAAVFVDALGNFLIPSATKSNYVYIMIIRSIMGFFQGTCFPGLHAMLSHWIPKQEFSRFIAFVYNSKSYNDKDGNRV